MRSSGKSIVLTLVALALATACTAQATPAPSPTLAPKPTPTPERDVGIHKIKHVVVIMQENRSFDSYFGTYPGADGIPFKNGAPAVCAPDPESHECVQPFHDPQDRNYGGPHAVNDALADINNGKMDGFIIRQRAVLKTACRDANDPACGNSNGKSDVMGYHDAREIPNYWAYAQDFVLHDRMFVSSNSWSLPSHLFMVSGWSAKCVTRNDPMSCNDARPPDLPPDFATQARLRPITSPNYAWTDLTYLLHKYNVSWKYYVAEGTEPDCEDDQMSCTLKKQQAGTPGIWNPLPWFTTVHEDKELSNIQTLDRFYEDARSGDLPAVSWVTPNGATSEHPPALVSAGQTYVTGLINAIMQGPAWGSTAIFLSWDDWGGFYDHVVPPTIDKNGYGLRVPSLVISPYAKKGYIDHQTLSFEAYLKFIEDDFLNGERIDPGTDGRPDRRPNVRENAPGLGDLAQDFDFSQAPRPPLVLPIHPTPGPASVPGS